MVVLLREMQVLYLMCDIFAGPDGQQYARSAVNDASMSGPQMSVSMKVESRVMMIIVQWRMTWMQKMYEKKRTWKKE